MTHSFFTASDILYCLRFSEYDDNDLNDEEELEWDDNWDDEVEGEDDFTKRLRKELESMPDQQIAQ